MIVNLRKCMKVEVIKASYLNEQHKHDIPMLLNEYSLDPMGGEQALSEYVKLNLVLKPEKLFPKYFFSGFKAKKIVQNNFSIYTLFRILPI